MIEFERIIGKPTNVEPGEDRIWFSANGGTIYVADSQGHPIRMSAGAIEGDPIPVGTPPEPNIIYYCKSNGKSYLSNAFEWKEIGVQSQPGSSTAPGGAGAIIITDPGNWYTSIDVEGAFYEIGANMAPFFGKKTLPIFSSNVFDWDDTGEKELALTATNKPSQVKAWVNQRKAEDGTVYGTAVDATGALYTRIGDSWERQASFRDFEELSSNITGNVEAVINKKVIAGEGLEGGGFIKDNPVLSISRSSFESMLATVSAPFLRTSGGTVTGDINLENQISRFTLTGAPKGSDQVSTPIVLQNDGTTKKAGFRDKVRGTRLLEFDMADGSFLMDTRKEGQGGTLNGTLTIKDIGQKTDAALVVSALGVRKPAIFKDDNGFVQFNNSETYNYIQSGNSAGKSKDFKISGPNNTQLDEVRLVSDRTYLLGRLLASGGLTIGKDGDGYGTVEHNNKLYLYPYQVDPKMKMSTAKRFYAHVGYNQETRTLDVRSFVKDNAVHYSKYVQKDIGVAATKFLSRSSEQFKNVHGKFNEKYDALEILRNVDSWLYDFKNDDKHKETSGFIIERGVPEFAIENETTIDTYAMLSVLWEAVKKLDKDLQKYLG